MKLFHYIRIVRVSTLYVHAHIGSKPSHVSLPLVSTYRRRKPGGCSPSSTRGSGGFAKGGHIDISTREEAKHHCDYETRTVIGKQATKKGS